MACDFIIKPTLLIEIHTVQVVFVRSEYLTSLRDVPDLSVIILNLGRGQKLHRFSLEEHLFVGGRVSQLERDLGGQAISAYHFCWDALRFGMALRCRLEWVRRGR